MSTRLFVTAYVIVDNASMVHRHLHTFNVLHIVDFEPTDSGTLIVLDNNERFSIETSYQEFRGFLEDVDLF